MFVRGKKKEAPVKALETLVPFLKRHSGQLLVGFVFMLVQNFSYMKVPKYLQVILDEIGDKNRGAVIRTNILYIFIFTALLAISLFLMRKLRIVF